MQKRSLFRSGSVEAEQREVAVSQPPTEPSRAGGKLHEPEASRHGPEAPDLLEPALDVAVDGHEVR